MQDKTLQLLRSEDASTQKEVYYQHCDRLMAVVYPYLGSVPDAEEVLQDTFLTIFEKIDLFDGQRGSFKSWSHRIAVNQALMFLRKKKGMKFTAAHLSQLPHFDGLSAATAALDQADLEHYLSHLSRKSAIVFRLKAIEGCSHQEIAEMLQIKHDASRAIFSRARKKLRAYLTDLKITN